MIVTLIIDRKKIVPGTAKEWGGNISKKSLSSLKYHDCHQKLQTIALSTHKSILQKTTLLLWTSVLWTVLPFIINLFFYFKFVLLFVYFLFNFSPDCSQSTLGWIVIIEKFSFYSMYSAMYFQWPVVTYLLFFCKFK